MLHDPSSCNWSMPPDLDKSAKLDYLRQNRQIKIVISYDALSRQQQFDQS